jgi:hypothetical protein
VHVDRDTAAVVGDGNGAVDVDGDLDAAAITGEVLVDRVVENFENAVVEAALVGVTDIHAGALANGIEAFQLIDLGGIINLRCGYLGFGFLWLVRRLGHSGAERSEIQPPETRNFSRKTRFFSPLLVDLKPLIISRLRGGYRLIQSFINHDTARQAQNVKINRMRIHKVFTVSLRSRY